MTKILDFPQSKKEGKNATTISRQFCSDCGGGLDLWIGTDNVAYGVCAVCDFDVGTKPLVLMETSD